METVFISKLKPLLDAVAEQMELYVPKKAGEHYVYSRYDCPADSDVELNNIRTCTPVKEFLFPVLETAATFPKSPEPEEIKACTPYLEGQIKAIKPEIICPLGRYSMKFLMEKFGLEDQIEGISKIHGKLFKSSNLFQGVTIIPFYHPAVATYNSNMKKILKEDFKILKTIIK